MSSIYIWSKNLVAESEAKDGGIWRAYSTSPQSFLLFSLRGQHNNILVLWTDNLVSDVMLVQKLYLAG